MKIIHTADWHIGQTLYGYDRVEEHEEFFHQLLSIVQEREPDVLLVCGDVFHTAFPSNTSVALCTKYLIQLREVAPKMQIILISGNHDSGNRFESRRDLWKTINIHTIGTLGRYENPLDFERNIIPIMDRHSGEKIGYVIAIPYLHPFNFPTLKEETPRNERQEEYFKSILSYVESINEDNLPVVLMSHLSVRNCDTTGHHFSIGGLESIPIESFGDKYDYFALGHIHCPQTLGGGGKVCYSGSPIAVDFDEDYPHCVFFSKIEREEKPSVECIKIHNPKPLLTLPHTAPVSFEESTFYLSTELPNERRGYIRLNITDQSPIPLDANERICDLLKEKSSKFCILKVNRMKEGRRDDTPVDSFTLDEIKNIRPEVVAQEYYKQITGKEMSKEMLDCLLESIKQVERDYQE